MIAIAPTRNTYEFPNGFNFLVIFPNSQFVLTINHKICRWQIASFDITENWDARANCEDEIAYAMTNNTDNDISTNNDANNNSIRYKMA